MDNQLEELMDFGGTWWGKHWIKSMLADKRKNKYRRMFRGIKYAKENRISNLIIQSGEVFALCLGSEKYGSQQYRIRLKFTPLEPNHWKKVVEKLSEKALYEAQLLTKEMPKDMDKIFTAAGVPLFPPVKEELNGSCSCPDESVPCKHMAALILILAKIFDYDPFKLIELRGRDRNALLEEIEAKSLENLGFHQKSKDIPEKTKISTNDEIPTFHFKIEKSSKSFSNIFEEIGELSEINNYNDFMEVIQKIYHHSKDFAYETAFGNGK